MMPADFVCPAPCPPVHPESDSARSDDLADWLRLTLTPGVGPVAVRKLLQAFGPPRQVLSQPAAALAGVAGARRAQALRAADPVRDAAVHRSLRWAESAGHRLLTLADADYPAALLNTPDPPPVLYVRGDAARLAYPSVAIVGSRNATRGGCDNARQLAAALAGAGLCVTSGLARGIDAAAHLGALDTPAGTIAVMATGMDRVYPPEHARLAERIAGCGALVTEAPPGSDSLPARFPRRNRIIAGLALGVVVVEAAPGSGSLITARLAGDIGREVFAVPGSIHSPLARGCNGLIQQGAKLVQTADDVLAELRFSPSGMGTAGARDAAAPAKMVAATGPAQPAADDALLALVGFDPTHPDELAERAGIADGALAARLLELELDGRIERLPDGRCLRRR